jgi:hypothetical protein
MSGDKCGDFLMEDEWEDGFTCTLPAGHEGAHRDMTDDQEVNVGTDRKGRRYEWAYEWAYADS